MRFVTDATADREIYSELNRYYTWQKVGHEPSRQELIENYFKHNKLVWCYSVKGDDHEDGVGHVGEDSKNSGQVGMGAVLRDLRIEQNPQFKA